MGFTETDMEIEYGDTNYESKVEKEGFVWNRSLTETKVLQNLQWIQCDTVKQILPIRHDKPFLAPT